MNSIEIRNLSFSYSKNKKALNDINLNIEKGEWIAILGHNGSGKSTLAKAMVGLLDIDEGSILYDGVNLNQDSVYEIRKKVGIVFQNPDNQFVGVTVLDDIAFGMENLSIPQQEMLKLVDFYAKKVKMNEYLDKDPQSLSGGQKQRVAIAGILAVQSSVMIFDEATSMLDPYARQDLMNYIKELNQEGITIIMITHDIKEAMYANRLVFIKNGELISDGDKFSVLSQPDLFKEAQLELPASLRLASMLEASNPLEKAVKDILWESISKM